MAEKYYTLTVKLGQDALVEYLQDNGYMDKSEIENCNLLSEATETVNGILSDHFSDYVVLDKDSVVFGEFEEAGNYWWEDNEVDDDEEDEDSNDSSNDEDFNESEEEE